MNTNMGAIFLQKRAATCKKYKNRDNVTKDRDLIYDT